ncbi:class I SAM-dependent methyltransferase [Cyanobacterium sp. Dongsha4]|uniref:class I SAM-dependent methyltransferase n=1 Tax=Cyanobacterium sp. DS4 TaxID=2878255 RepID=UPI002E8039E6|nr:class I SAM-dependent methyltransferase [Cyanobacterium sp. Dongsha4]WVL02244.1 class I SAM-dependent methyltransferase [Cyanobacterium sp. Dongsha4]
MNKEITESLQQQYDSLPYPQIPLEQSPQEYYDTLFIHDLTTPYYLYQQKIIDTKDKIILDAGCGSGWTSLFLAYANPGAKIIGVDLSAKSVEVAKTRLNYHGFTNSEFYALSIEDIGQLNYCFDYINCDEVIYLLPEPEKVLKFFQSVINNEGIIRVNFHSYYQRFNFFRLQNLFKNMGLMDSNPDDLEVEIVKETFNSLNDTVGAKQLWQNKFSRIFNQPEKLKQSVLVNYLLQGDKGFTIPQVFEMLNSANLNFLSMVIWRQWNIRDLFQNPNDLPDIWELGLAEISPEEELSLYELLNPIHRLIDFWCVNNSSQSSTIPLVNWDINDWKKAKISLHPRLKYSKIKEDLLKAIQTKQSFLFNNYISFPAKGNVEIESDVASCLLVLWEAESVTLEELINRWLIIQPNDLISLESKSLELAYEELINVIVRLENFLYVLVEKIN